jgi:hypothetical protein
MVEGARFGRKPKLTKHQEREALTSYHPGEGPKPITPKAHVLIALGGLQP